MILVKALLLIIGLCVAAVVAFLVHRSLGKSYFWRFRRGLRRLTADSAMEQYPSLDDAGRLLVYEAIPERWWEIRVRDLTSGEDHAVSERNFHCRRPRLSGNGRWVVYEKTLSRTPVRSSRVVARDLRYGTDHVLGATLDYVLSAAVSRDGARVLVCGVHEGRRKVRLHEGMDPMGRLIADDAGEEIAPAIDASGHVAAFLASDGSGPDARFVPCIVDVGSGVIRRVDEASDCRAIALSGDGRWLAWETRGDGPARIRLLDIRGGRAATIGNGFTPVLGADGSLLAFDTIDDAFDLRVVEPATGRRVLVQRGNPYPSRAFLAPDNRTLVFCSGIYNALSKTGDTDVFAADLTTLRAPAEDRIELSWEPHDLVPLGPRAAPDAEAAPEDAEAPSEEPSAAPSPGSGSGIAPAVPAPQAPFPRNSMFVASWLFRNDGSMKMPEAQDSDTIAVYSERVAAMVDRVRRLTGAPRVNLVCHCMGGLVAKGMIQYFHDGRLGYPLPDGTEPWHAVNRLVTLASPLRGNRFFGFLPLLARLDVPYYRKGFRRQAHDMVRGSEFLRRLNQGSRWADVSMGDPGACYKPDGPDQPPFYISLTSDSYGFMDGGVEIAASHCEGLPGSATHLADDVFALMYETVDGRCTFEKARRLVHVPEDVYGDFVVEDKCKALTDYILKNFERDVPILFVHGSYLFRGLAELSWQVMMRRLAGEVEGWPAGYVYPLGAPGGEPIAWMLDANYDPR